MIDATDVVSCLCEHGFGPYLWVPLHGPKTVTGWSPKLRRFLHGNPK